MPVVNAFEHFNSLQARKRFSLPNKYGRIIYGWSEYGLEDDLAGVYQIKSTPKGQVVSRENFYWPKNPQKPAQQAWRAVFKQGFDAWKALSESEKDEYRKEARKYHFSGFNLFMKNWLNSHKL